MGFVMILMIMIVIAIAIFIMYAIHISKSDQHGKTLRIFSRIIKIGLIVVIITQAVLIIVTLFSVKQELIIGLNLVKLVLNLTFMILVYQRVVKLLDNLSNKNIFVKENSKYTKEVGLLCLYFALTETVIGLILGLIVLAGTGNFQISIATNNTTFIYIIIGLTLQVISKILKQSSDIYEENQLTI